MISAFWSNSKQRIKLSLFFNGVFSREVLVWLRQKMLVHSLSTPLKEIEYYYSSMIISWVMGKALL